VDDGQDVNVGQEVDGRWEIDGEQEVLRISRAMLRISKAV
jgi:hypothetical protein